MKKEDFKNYKGKNLIELDKNLKSMRDKLLNLKLGLVSGKVKNVKEIRQVKKSIAQILTLINEKTKRDRRLG